MSPLAIKRRLRAPHERDPEPVPEDVLDGYVTVEGV